MVFIIGENEEKTNDREKVREGTLNAVCVGFWDLGYQVTKSKDHGEKIQRKIMFAWEVDQKMSDGEYAGKNMRIYSRYTLSSHEKSNLAKILKSWSGKALTSDEVRNMDLEALKGTPCMLSVVHNGDYANVENVIKLPDSMNELKYDSLMDEKPEWIQKIIDNAVPRPLSQTEQANKAIDEAVNGEKQDDIQY